MAVDWIVNCFIVVLLGSVFFVLCGLSFRLLRCGRLPFASQLGWLGLLQHGADIVQTQLHLSLLRRKSRAVSCLLPLVLLGKDS